jgi:hypothetical protein
MPDPALELIGIEKVSSVEYLNAVMGCYRDGRIAVPVDPGKGPPAGHRFAELLKPAPGGGWFTLHQAPVREDGPAQVSFSSGTTGEPKAVLLSHRALADVTDRLIDVMEIDGEISEYLGVPATYSFGLARARVCAAVGGRLFVPENGFNPSELAAMLEADEVNALSAVPTLLRVLIANPDLMPKKIARRLRWLEIGSQPMSVEEKQAIRRIFPAARIIQHYGLTEASRTTFLDLQEASDEQLATVGRPIGRTEVRIDSENRICIRGPHVAEGLLTAHGLEPIVDADGWLQTRDLGSIGADGFLTFEGRADDLLNIGGIKVPADLFEKQLGALLGADAVHIAVTSRPDPMRGETVMVAHMAHVAAARLAEHARTVGAGFGLGNADLTFVEVDEIPRTETGKVQRTILIERHAAAAKQMAGGAAPKSAAPVAAATAGGGDDELRTDREREIARIWCQALNVPSMGRNDTFFDMGGDSLSAITAILAMERAGVPKELTQQIFQGRTIAQIAASEAGEAVEHAPLARAEVSDAITMTRGILVGVVLFGHWLPFLFVRAGELAPFLLHWSVPFFRLGTPGFAMVFGIGLAFFGLPMVEKHPERLRSNTRTNVMLLASGVAAMALFKLTRGLLMPEGLDAIWPSRLFYNVLTSYLLLVATSGFVLRFIVRRRYPPLATAIMALASLFVSEALRFMFRDIPTTGFADLLRLLVTAKYGYAEMLGYVLIGVVMGIWIDRAHEEKDLPARAMMAGTAFLIGAALVTLTFQLGDDWFQGAASLEMVVGYAGCVLILFGLILHAVHGGYTRGRARVPFRILTMIGILAFAVYVGQELVMSFNDILGALHLPMIVALGTPLLLFFGGMTILIRRFYRLYY